MKKSTHDILVALVLAGITAAAAAQSSSFAQEPSGGPQRMQERITREARHELVMLPQLTIFDNLKYKVDGNAVTLMGEVRNAVLKDEAQNAVKKIEGVSSRM